MAKIFNENKGNESIPRNLIFDTTLSDRARFVYCYMSAKPEGWDFILAPMAKELGYSVETLRKYIAELVESGWIIKGEQGYDKETGKFSNVDYTIKNNPSPCRKKPVSEKTRVGKNHTQDNNSSPINSPTIKDIEDKKRECNKLPSQKKGDSPTRFVKPTIEQISDYIKEKGYHFDAEQFFYFYESKGWVVGKNSPMRDWHAACSTWEVKRKSQKEEKEEDSAEEETLYPEGMDAEQWNEITMWMCNKVPLIAGKIDPISFVQMKDMAGDSKLFSELLKQVNEDFSLDSSHTVKSVFYKRLKEYRNGQKG